MSGASDSTCALSAKVKWHMILMAINNTNPPEMYSPMIEAALEHFLQ
jgi:uncharacterized membrane protein YagU involved in acid resistance